MSTFDSLKINKNADITGTLTTATLNATNFDTTTIEATNIKAKDGTSSATIANSTGIMTIASSVLTTADINGGTIDGATIGGATPTAGTFTNVGATTGNITTVNATTVYIGDLKVNNASYGAVFSDIVDLTTLNDMVVVIPKNTYGATKRIVVTKATAFITTALATDTATPVVTIQDEDDVSSGITIADFANADAINDVRLTDTATGDSKILFTHDKDIEVKVTTAGTDAGTAAGACRVLVEYVVISL